MSSGLWVDFFYAALIFCFVFWFFLCSVWNVPHTESAVSRAKTDTVCCLLLHDGGLLITCLMKAKWIQLLSQITEWFSFAHRSLAETVIRCAATNSASLPFIILHKLDRLEKTRLWNLQERLKNSELFAAALIVAVKQVLLGWKFAWLPGEQPGSIAPDKSPHIYPFGFWL